MRAAANLADQGKYQCRFCKEVKPLEEGIVVSWGGNVMFALCPICYPGKPIIMEERPDSEGNRTVFIGFLRERDTPTSEILRVKDMNEARAFLPIAGIAKKEKNPIDPEDY